MINVSVICPQSVAREGCSRVSYNWFIATGANRGPAKISLLISNLLTRCETLGRFSLFLSSCISLDSLPFFFAFLSSEAIFFHYKLLIVQIVDEVMFYLHFIDVSADAPVVP